MLLALAIYAAFALAFYWMLVRLARHQPESLEEMDSKWSDFVEQETKPAEKAA